MSGDGTSMGASATATDAGTQPAAGAAEAAAAAAPAEAAEAAAPPAATPAAEAAAAPAPAAAPAAAAPEAAAPAAAAPAAEEAATEPTPAPAGAVPVEPGLVTPGTKPEEGGKGAGRGKGGIRIHARNLAATATTAQLKELFAPYGEVMEAEAKTTEDGKCKGFGFVVLPTADEAEKAVAELNKKEVDGKELIVILAERKPKGTGKGEVGKGGKEGGKKGKGKGEKGEKGEKGKFKGKGRGAAAAAQPGMTAGGYPPAYNPYFYGMPPYAYGMYPPYMYGMPPYPGVSPAHAAAAAAYSPAHAAQAAHAAAAYQAAQAAAMQMWASPTAAAAVAAAGQMQAAGAVPPAAPPVEGTTPKVASPFFPPGAGAATPAGGKASAAAAPAEPERKGKGKGRGKGRKGKEGKGGAATEAPKEQPKDAPPPDKEFVGVLKSLSEKNGYGFIACDAAKELYQRDVWVDSNLLPENARISARLKFNMTLSPKGHPQAQHVRTA